MPNSSKAIGIFDSGLGGLTVLSQVTKRLPNETIIYLGDTARVPYGTKSADTVVRYARSCASLLLSRGIKLLIVACNTASAYALETLRSELDIPVVGVIQPGATAVAARTKTRRVGVIGTAGTVASGAYVREIHAIDAEIQVYSKACPLFVPLAEEGWTDGDVPRTVATEYLKELTTYDIDALVLGCTHYPLLKRVIADIMGDGVALVDSAETTADTVSRLLAGSPNVKANGAHYHFMVSDAPESFARVGKRFLGHDIDHVEWVDF